MLALCLMLSVTYYAHYYAHYYSGIIGWVPSEIYQMTNRCLLVITKSLGTVYNISFLQYFTKFEWQYNYVDMYHQLTI